jgi:hypothetical protein
MLSATNTALTFYYAWRIGSMSNAAVPVKDARAKESKSSTS